MYTKRKKEDLRDLGSSGGLRENVVFQKEKEALKGLLGRPGKGRVTLRFQKERILYFTGRRIAGDPGRMEEIFDVLKQRTAWWGTWDYEDLGGGQGWGLTSPLPLTSLSLFPLQGPVLYRPQRGRWRLWGGTPPELRGSHREPQLRARADPGEEWDASGRAAGPQRGGEPSPQRLPGTCWGCWHLWEGISHVNPCRDLPCPDGGELRTSESWGMGEWTNKAFGGLSPHLWEPWASVPSLMSDPEGLAAGVYVCVWMSVCVCVCVWLSPNLPSPQLLALTQG